MRLIKGFIHIVAILVLTLNWAGAQNHYSHIYFFGDSLTDIGNLVTAPHTNKPGIMWPNVVSEFYEIPLAKSGLLGELGGNNWAVAGATSNQLVGKIEAFLSKNPIINPNDLFIIWIGSNDIIYRVLAKWPLPDASDDVVYDATKNIGLGVSLLQQSGAQNIMLMNILGIDLTPYAQKRQSRYGNKLTTELKSVLSKFNTRLARIPSVHYFDGNARLQKVLSDYKAYGFTNVTDPLKKCRGDVCKAEEYIFWDGVHPTNAAHKLIGEFVIEFLEGKEEL